MKKHRGHTLLLAVFLVGFTPPAWPQSLASFEKRITVKVLDNGLTVLGCERPEAPVVSFFTHVNEGGNHVSGHDTASS